MQKRQILNRMFGIATIAMMFGASSAIAQSDAAQSSGAGTQQQSSGASQSSGTSGSSSQKSSTGSSAQVSKSDQKMMQEIAQTNLSEIETAKLAKQKSQNKEVQQFAHKMIEDHTDAQDKLQAMADEKGVKLPTQPDKKHQAAMKKMESLSAEKFDKQYIAQGGLQDHKQAQKMLSRVEQKAQDEDLKELARNMLPKINEHLETARETHSEMTRSSGSSGASGSSDSSGSSDTSGSSSASPGTSPSTSESSGASSVTGTHGSSNATGPSK